MPHGKTLELQEFDRLQDYRAKKIWVPTHLDRSLRGKARVKARKAQNKLAPTPVQEIDLTPTEGDTDV